MLYNFFFFENRAVDGIMCKPILELGRQQMTIWRMNISCWIPKAKTHTRIVQYSLPFHYNKGCTNVPQCYVIRTLSVLLYLVLGLNFVTKFSASTQRKYCSNSACSCTPVTGIAQSETDVHSCQQKSIGLKFSKSQTGNDVRYSCHHNSSRFTLPIFAHSCRFSVLHSLQSITPRIY